MSAGSSGEDVDRDADGSAHGGSVGAAEGESFADEAAVADLRGRVESLRRDLEAFEDDVDDRTVHRSEIESDLRAYVRARVRRGHARGWGPYLVLLYGTAMTIGAFYMLNGGWAILAMFVVWLSTLGLYVLMVLFGGLLGLASLPGRVARRIRKFRG